MNDEIVVVRGGGDIATGVVQKLFRSGFKVLILEIEKPTAIRRKVSLCEAVYDKKAIVEDTIARLVSNIDEIKDAWNDGVIPLMVDENGEYIKKVGPTIVVDAILAKRNKNMHMDLADITIGLGPGFYAGQDVHVVVETMRGHDLGRLIFLGAAEENTGIPGEIGGYSKARVIHSPISGIIKNLKKIGDVVKLGDVIALIDEVEVKATIPGVLRGLIRDEMFVKKGLKIADIDPRLTEVKNCFTISDKARCIGGAVLEAIWYMKKIKEKKKVL